MALLPFLVVLAAFAPVDLGGGVVNQVRDARGLSEATIRPVADLVAQGGSVGTDGGLFRLLVAHVSATSLSRTLARVYGRVFEVHAGRGSRRVVKSVVWLPAWLLFIATVVLLTRWPQDARGGVVVVAGLALSTVAQLVFWWWSSHHLLLGRVSWPQLLPAALVTTAGSTAMIRCSPLVMPTDIRSSIEHVGSFGLVISAATGLVAFSGVLVAASLAGRSLAEQEAWHRMVAQGLRILNGRGAT